MSFILWIGFLGFIDKQICDVAPWACVLPGLVSYFLMHKKAGWPMSKRDILCQKDCTYSS